MVEKERGGGRGAPPPPPLCKEDVRFLELEKGEKGVRVRPRKVIHSFRRDPRGREKKTFWQRHMARQKKARDGQEMPSTYVQTAEIHCLLPHCTNKRSIANTHSLLGEVCYWPGIRLAKSSWEQADTLLVAVEGFSISDPSKTAAGLKGGPCSVCRSAGRSVEGNIVRLFPQ